MRWILLCKIRNKCFMKRGYYMIVNGWNYDFESLPCWDNRERMPWITDTLFENSTSDTACLIYSIAEASMMNYVGFLAILKNKQSPYLFLNIIDFCFPKQEVVFNTTGNLVFLQSNLYNESSNELARPLIIIDCKENRFSYYKTNNINPCYKIIELDKNTFGIKADEYQKNNDRRLFALSKKKIRIDRLKWYDIEALSNFKNDYFGII